MTQENVLRPHWKLMESKGQFLKFHTKELQIYFVNEFGAPNLSSVKKKKVFIKYRMCHSNRQSRGFRLFLTITHMQIFKYPGP